MFARVKSAFMRWLGFLTYHFPGKNHYVCTLVGEKAGKDPFNTIVVYRFIGKRDIYKISLRELLNDHELVAKFHPTQAIKLGAIAMGDLLFSENEESSRRQKFEAVKRKLLDTI